MKARKSSVAARALNWKPEDAVVTAWSERPVGPGWANQIVWVIVRNAVTGRLRQEALQPEEQTEAILHEFAYSCLASQRMTAAVRAAVSQ